MRLSVSNIKLFLADKKKRASNYLMWVEDSWNNWAYIIGNIFHDIIEMTVSMRDGIEDIDRYASRTLENNQRFLDHLQSQWWNRDKERDKWVDQLSTLLRHFQFYKDRERKIVFREGYKQGRLVIKELDIDVDFWYIIDAIDEEDVIIDYKSCTYFTQWWDTKKSFFWGISTWQSYQLQMWLYMLLEGKSKSCVVEFLKKKYKKYDREQWHQIFYLELTPQFHQEMLELFWADICKIIDILNLKKKYDKNNLLEKIWQEMNSITQLG